MEKYINMLKSNGAETAIVIKASSVVTAPWTIYKCRYGCSSYGNNLCCPPNAPSYEETRKILDCYSSAVLFHTHEMSTITPLALETVREMFLDDYYKAIAFGAGSCNKCTKCSLTRCNFPGQTIPSMEACGIDVFATVRANGLEIHTLRDENETHNYFGLILYE